MKVEKSCHKALLKAAEFLMFNRKLNALEAFERNLVTQIIPHNEFQSKTSSLIESLSKLPKEVWNFLSTWICFKTHILNGWFYFQVSACLKTHHKRARIRKAKRSKQTWSRCACRAMVFSRVRSSYDAVLVVKIEKLIHPFSFLYCVNQIWILEILRIFCFIEK